MLFASCAARKGERFSGIFERPVLCEAAVHEWQLIVGMWRLRALRKEISMRRAIFIALAIAAAAGCGRAEQTEPERVRSFAPVAADNTGRNERDQNTATLTPGDQGESEADRTITQRVRQGVVAHDGLSMTATNVKIVTVDGIVTLRGPVLSREELNIVTTIARQVEGVRRVDNQLEIASR